MSGRRPLWGLLAAFAVARTGTAVSAIALPWYVLVTTDSAVRTGLAAFCELVPYVAAKALAGPVADRAGPRTVSWTTDLVSALCIGLIPLLAGAGALPFWLLLVLVALIGAARGPGDLAKEVMVPEAADRSGVPMERATGLSGVVERLAGTVGPAVSGVLVALTGALAGLAVNAVCFALGSLIIAAALPRGMGAAPPGPSPEGPGGAGAASEPGYWRRFAEGIAYFRADRLLSGVIVLVAVTNFLDAAFSSVLLPLWARESGHGTPAVGLVGSCFGVAAIGGSVTAAAVAHRLRRRPVLLLGFLISGAPRFGVLALVSDGAIPLGAALVLFAVSGFGAGFVNPIIGAIVFERVPRYVLGRTQAFGDSLAAAGIPLGGLVAGAAVSAAGLLPVLLAATAVYLTATTVPALLPSWRDMDRRPGRAAGPAGQPPPTPTTPPTSTALPTVAAGAGAGSAAGERGPVAT
ncbi:MFS transporter [Streptomyces sp. MS19]|uniref:MFS transporter n=1 Tax=Streptomyces sp. MS19 TaxID=3385972 RepID=UPI0039A179E3